MFLHLERIWLEVLFFEVSLMQTWQWVAFEVTGTNTRTLSSFSFSFLFPLSLPLSSFSFLFLPSISPSLIAKRTVFLPQEPQFTAFVPNGEKSKHTLEEEIILEQIKLQGSLKWWGTEWQHWNSCDVFMNKWHMKVSYYEKLKISRANLAQRWLSDEEFMRLNENMSGCVSWEEDWAPLKAMWLSRFQAANVCFANSIFVVLY